MLSRIYFTLCLTCNKPGEQEAAEDTVTDAGEDPRPVLALPLLVPIFAHLPQNPEHVVDYTHCPGDDQVDRDHPLQGAFIQVQRTCKESKKD